MKRVFNAIILFVVSFSCFAVEINSSVLDERELPDHLGYYRHFQMTSSNEISKIDFYVVKLSDTYHARLYLQPVATQSQAHFMGNLMPPQHFMVAINGGYYSPDFQPVGLFIDRGKVLKRFSRNRLLNSCVLVNQKGVMTLVPRCDKSPSAFYAMQTGPLLIENGKEVDVIKSLQAHSKVPASFFDPHPRTLLAESENGTLLAIITSAASLSEVVAILKNDSKALGVEKIKTALNLDGGASTGMIIRMQNNPIYIQEKKPVKALVLFGNAI